MRDTHTDADKEMVLGPPMNLEVEQAILGAVMLDNGHFDGAGGLLPQHFFDPLHAAIWQAISDCVAANRSATPVTLRHIFETATGPDGRPASHYLGQLVADTPGRDVAEYARIIREHSQRRHIIIVAEDMAAAAYDRTTPPREICERAEHDLAAVADVAAAQAEVSMDMAARQVLDISNSAFQRGGGLAGISTGIRDIDLKLGGLQSSDLIVLAGRPAMGKSALATNIAVNIASGLTDHTNGEVIHGHVHMFSLEMSAAQLAMRVVGERSGISGDRLRRGDFADRDMRRIEAAARAVGALPITIDETGGIALPRLAARARRLKRRRGTRLIVIDYLQLMGVPADGRAENRVQQITAITMGLKALAKELQVPVLCLSQLSRKVEERSDKRPQLADLRESGSIEQDADAVIFVYRDDYYLNRDRPPDEDENGMPNPKLRQWQERMANATGKAEVIVAKNRHGSTGIVHLAFDAEATRFSSLAREGAGK